jgi:hypothetical protein
MTVKTSIVFYATWSFSEEENDHFFKAEITLEQIVIFLLFNAVLLYNLVALMVSAGLKSHSVAYSLAL